MQLAGIARRELGVPTIGVGGIRLPEQAQAVLDTGTADLVAVGRGILADPGWAAKTLADEPDEIEYCVDCQPRCYHFKEPEKCPARRRLAARGA
jgi:2,4-dienoyl-CoA reductase-like NADH-dependent reductase (Old Yellow Enzyme family)